MNIFQQRRSVFTTGLSNGFTNARAATVCLAILFSSLLQSSFAQSPDAKSKEDKITTEFLETVVKEFKVPGMVAAVVREGKVATMGAAGVRKQGDRTPITTTDLLHLGSCTKAMTGTLIADLIADEEVDLAWDSTIGDVLKKLKNDIHGDYHDVTLEQLLSHCGGLPANETGTSNESTRKIHNQRLRAIRKTLKAAPPTPVGEFLYSNMGYIVAGTMAETVTGKTWENLVQERLFKPLGMDSAGFGPPGKRGKIEQPWGHVFVANKHAPVQIDNVPVLGPAGRVHCTISDWAKFLSLHLSSDSRPPKILDVATIRRLQKTTVSDQYAVGWLVGERGWAGGKILNHAGSNTSWYAVVWAAPGKDFATLVVTNCGGGEAPAACDKVAGHFIERFASD